MARRTGATGTKPGQNHVAGSIFDPTPPVRLPTGLSPAKRKATKQILAENPHLGQADLAGVLRLVDLRQIHQQMVEALDAAGVVTMDGEPSPMIGKISTLSGSIVSLERALCMTTGSKREKLSKAEQKAPPKPAAGKGPNVTRLRLA